MNTPEPTPAEVPLSEIRWESLRYGVEGLDSLKGMLVAIESDRRVVGNYEVRAGHGVSRSLSASFAGLDWQMELERVETTRVVMTSETERGRNEIVWMSEQPIDCPGWRWAMPPWTKPPSGTLESEGEVVEVKYSRGRPFHVAFSINGRVFASSRLGADEAPVSFVKGVSNVVNRKAPVKSLLWEGFPVFSRFDSRPQVQTLLYLGCVGVATLSSAYLCVESNPS